MCNCCGRNYCNLLCNLLIAIFWTFVLFPLLLFQLIIVFLTRTIIGIIYGIFTFPCLLDENKITVKWYHIVVGIILLPFTLIIFIYLGIKSAFD